MLIPTRWRPQFLLKCLNSIRETAEDKNCFEMLIRATDGDVDTEKILDLVRKIPNTKVVSGDGSEGWQGLGSYHQQMVDISSGEWVWFLNDDIEFKGSKWDSELRKVPKVGYYVLPQFDILDFSLYENTVKGPFPCIPNGSWADLHLKEKTLPMGFNIDTSLHDIYIERSGWKPWFLSGVTIHHHRHEAKKFDQMWQKTKEKTYSQAGQDVFVRKLIPRIGTFLDIGCGDYQYSNTLALEQDGWSGTLLDVGDGAGKDRLNPFIRDDAKTHKWDLPPMIDYLSLDVDESTLEALKNLPLKSTRFKVITIEHDAYRFGDTLRGPQRKILKELGYTLVCGDVSNPTPFEDWWVDLDLVESARPFMCHGKHWAEILKMA